MKTKKREYVDAQKLRTVLHNHIRFCNRLTTEMSTPYVKGLLHGRKVEAQHILKEISFLHTKPTHLFDQKLSTSEVKEILNEIESETVIE